MFFNVLKHVSSVFNQVGKMNIKGFPRAIINLLVFQLVFLILLFILGLIVKFYLTGELDFSNTLSLIKTLVSGEFLLAVGIVGKGMMDLNHDGIPDWYQEIHKDDSNRLR